MGEKWAFFRPIFFAMIPGMDIPAKEPTSVTANDTLIWSRRLPDYPPGDGWVLSYSLRGPASLEISATADDLGYVVNEAAPEVAGDYYLQGYVARGNERHTVYNGTLEVAADLTTVTGVYDGRSPAKKILDSIDAVIANRATMSDMEKELDVAGNKRRLKSMSHAEIIKARGVYARKVWREKNPGRICSSVQVRFGGR